MTKPTHDFVRGDGSAIEYEATTNIPCPVCNTDAQWEDRRLCVVMTIDNTKVMECPNCAHAVHMHKDVYEKARRDYA